MLSTISWTIRNNSKVSEFVGAALSQGFQVTPDAIIILQGALESKSNKELNLAGVLDFVIESKSRSGKSSTISKKDLVDCLPDIFAELDTGLPLSKDQQTSSPKGEFEEKKKKEEEFEIVDSFSQTTEPTGIEGFASLFRNRYGKLLKILSERPEARQITKIARLRNGQENSSSNNNVGSKKNTATSKIAGLLLSKRQTKNGVELTIDDDTGKISLLAMGENAKKASEITLDQCAMFELESKQGKFFIKNVIQPDLPKRIPSVSKKTAYAVFLSDLHIGSNKFLEGAFNRFLDWLLGKYREEEIDEEIVRRLKYLVIGGDIVDGVGVFPNQEYELAESDIFKQYKMVHDKISLIPANFQILMIPGNHDSARQALPQPMIPRKYAEALYDLPNLTMLSDPCVVRLNGVSVMVFHGRSLDDVLATTPGLSYEQPTGAMQVLLRARHLAPIFGQRTPIAPDLEDHLVVDHVPDIFHAGHVHTVGVDTYKGTLMINSGTWQAQTGYQANLGIMPRPGLVPIVNLATLDVTFRDFLTTNESSS